MRTREYLQPTGEGTVDDPFFPDVEVRLLNVGQQASAIMGAVTEAMRRESVHPDFINRFRMEASSGNYYELLQTAMRWVGTEMSTVPWDEEDE